MFIEPQQRFTIRKGATTIGTGVFTNLLPPRTEEEKDSRVRKKLMKVFTAAFYILESPFNGFLSFLKSQLCVS